MVIYYSDSDRPRQPDSPLADILWLAFPYKDRNRKPAEIQRLTGIPKATVYRLVERYHRENPVTEANTMSETKSDEEMRGETETAS